MRRSVSWCAQSRDSKATFNNNLMQTWHYTFGPHAPQTQVLCGFLNRPTAATVEDGSRDDVPDVGNMPVMGWWEQGWRLTTPVVPAFAGTHNHRALLFSQSVCQFDFP